MLKQKKFVAIILVSRRSPPQTIVQYIYDSKKWQQVVLNLSDWSLHKMSIDEYLFYCKINPLIREYVPLKCGSSSFSYSSDRHTKSLIYLYQIKKNVLKKSINAQTVCVIIQLLLLRGRSVKMQSVDEENSTYLILRTIHPIQICLQFL